MRKKWFASAIVMLFAVGTLFGCGSKNQDSAPDIPMTAGTTEIQPESGEDSRTEPSTSDGTTSDISETGSTTLTESSEAYTNAGTTAESAIEESTETSTEAGTESSTGTDTEAGTESSTETDTEPGMEGGTEAGAEEGGPVEANFYGTWRGAEKSLDGNYYTGYLTLELTEKTWHTVDQEAGNPDFDADIIEVTSNEIIMKPTMVDNAPANWELREGEETKITYKNPNQYELWLTYNDMTCVFYREMKSSDMAGPAGDFIDPYVGPYWKVMEGGSLGIVFGYYDLKFVDMSAGGKTILSGKIIIDAENSRAEVIPDITQGVLPNDVWPELMDGTHFTMELEHFGEEEIRVTCFGKTVSFTPAEPEQQANTENTDN